MSELIVYGIKSCDTVKKAMKWLDDHGVAYSFHDFKSKGISEAKLKAWVKQMGRDTLVNRKGMTWRQLDEATKEGVTTDAAAIALMKEKKSVIKRPVVEQNNQVKSLGFDESLYRETFGRL